MTVTVIQAMKDLLMTTLKLVQIQIQIHPFQETPMSIMADMATVSTVVSLNFFSDYKNFREIFKISNFQVVVVIGVLDVHTCDTICIL